METLKVFIEAHALIIILSMAVLLVVTLYKYWRVKSKINEIKKLANESVQRVNQIRLDYLKEKEYLKN